MNYSYDLCEKKMWVNIQAFDPSPAVVKNLSKCFVVSVFPAPDSPEIIIACDLIKDKN